MAFEAHQEKRHFQAEVKQLLDIVVHSLYSNKEIFLRELISNASDASDKLRFEALSNSAWYEGDSELAIKVIYDKEARTITISDNGIGMSRDEVIDHIGTIAKSGTKEFIEKLKQNEKADRQLIGQFGVGFYSAFIVADKVTVKTRRAGLSKEYGVSWESKGDGEYEIANIEKESRGTDVILHLKENEDEFLDDFRIKNIITKYSDHINIPIRMQKTDENGNKKDEWETVNRATALWSLPKNSIKEEEYQTFYKHIAHDFENALSYTHHKVEGSKLDYSTILYLPTHAPFDLWQRDAQQGLKLYVQRVFILDKVEQFLPHYLRFMRGILDTTSLPLNVSREILQDHPSIPKLRSALTKHTLDLLDRLAKDESEKYKTFWKEFGVILKEGPAEDFTNKERIAKLLRFASTHTDLPDQTVTLDEYIKRMKPEQKKIYYITAENFNAAKASPHLEIFRKNNLEVLLLSDKIDEWVFGHLTEFEGKPLQSVAKGDLNLDEIVTDEATKEKEKAQEAKDQTEFEGLLKRIKETLSEDIKEVRLSHRLTSSPACLVRDQNELGPQMERLLRAAGQQITEVKPILEINPTHPIISTLHKQIQNPLANDWIRILFEQALLSEGTPLPDPSGFVTRINTLWMTIFKN